MQESESVLTIDADLDWEHGDLVWHVNVVPDTQVSSVLSYNDITKWYPLDVGTVAE